MEQNKQRSGSPKISLPLKEIIRSIHCQLIESENERKDMKLPAAFHVKNVELEMNFIIEREFETQAEANIVVVDANSSYKYRKEEVHKIKLTLESNSDIDLFSRMINPIMPKKLKANSEL